jgi:hypothetical protein
LATASSSLSMNHVGANHPGSTSIAPVYCRASTPAASGAARGSAPSRMRRGRRLAELGTLR